MNNNQHSESAGHRRHRQYEEGMERSTLKFIFPVVALCIVCVSEKKYEKIKINEIKVTCGVKIDKPIKI